jgi:hypothetical protein
MGAAAGGGLHEGLVRGEGGGRLDRATGERVFEGRVAVRSGMARPPELDPAEGPSSVFFLCARQHSGQRHSTTKSPPSPRRRDRRHPNCALMSV